MIEVQKFPLGELMANCYFVTDSESDCSFVVDPGAESDMLIKQIDSFGSEKLKYILLTHGHFDHIGFAAGLKKKYPGAKLIIGADDSGFTNNDSLNLCIHFGISCDHFDADVTVNDGDSMPFGKDAIKVISTPGHTAGSICFLVGNSIFTGDTLMSMSCGRTDFPTGSYYDMLSSLRKLYDTEGDPYVYCGHGNDSRLEYERKNNPAMRTALNEHIY